jgi:hypothetical protein
MKIPRQVHAIARAISTAPGAVGAGVAPALHIPQLMPAPVPRRAEVPNADSPATGTPCQTACARYDQAAIQALGCKCGD